MCGQRVIDRKIHSFQDDELNWYVDTPLAELANPDFHFHLCEMHEYYFSHVLFDIYSDISWRTLHYS